MHTIDFQPKPSGEKEPRRGPFFRVREDVERTGMWSFGWRAKVYWRKASSERLRCVCDCCQFRQFVAGGFRLSSKKDSSAKKINVYVGDLWRYKPTPYEPPVANPYPWEDHDRIFRTYDIDPRNHGGRDLGGYVEDIACDNAAPWLLWHPFYDFARADLPSLRSAAALADPATGIVGKQLLRLKCRRSYGDPSWMKSNSFEGQDFVKPRLAQHCGVQWEDEPRLRIADLLREPYDTAEIEFAFLFVVRTDLDNRRCQALPTGRYPSMAWTLIIQSLIERVGDTGFNISGQRWRVVAGATSRDGKLASHHSTVWDAWNEEKLQQLRRWHEERY